MAMPKLSFLDPDPVDVDAFYLPDEPTASDQILVFEGNQEEEEILLTSTPSLFPESMDGPVEDGSYQNMQTDVISTYDVIPSDTTSTYEVASLENLVSMVSEEAYSPSPDGPVSGDIWANAFPWSEAFPVEEAFPPIEQVLPLDSIFGVQDNVSSVCRDKSAQWALCCRGAWNGPGQRNVDKCDLCRLPSIICPCTHDYMLLIKDQSIFCAMYITTSSVDFIFSPDDPDNPSWMCQVPMWQYCCKRYFPGVSPNCELSNIICKRSIKLTVFYEKTGEGAVCTKGWS